jgi:hypothetical protein
VPTSAIDAVSSKYALNLDDVGIVFIGEATIPDASWAARICICRRAGHVANSLLMMAGLS